MSTPLAAYLDAVSDALTGVGIGVDLDAVDDAARTLAIDLAPVSPGRRPTMLWTPDAGWRIAMATRGKVSAATIRYLGAGPVPFPSQVAEAVARWLADPESLTDVQPVYETVPRLLTAALADAAGMVQ